jgi:diguanylate cyclase (GGDEF)-like protein
MKNIISSFKRLSIKSRMIISLTFILTVSFITTNYINYRSAHRSVRENLVNSVLPLTRDNLYSEIQTHLIRPIFISSLMANDTFLKDWAISGERNMPVIQKYLKAIQDKYGFFSAFFVSEKTGKYYHFKGLLKTISTAEPHDVWYYNFIKLNREYVLDVDTDEASSGKLTVFINHRLTGYHGELLGVTGVGLNLDAITQMLKSHNDIYKSEIYLVDREGTIQIHSDESIIEKINIKNQPEYAGTAEKILSGKETSGMYEFERDGKHILLTTRFIPEFDWFLFVEIDEGIRMSGILSGIKMNLIFGLLISCIIISIAIATANYFQGRLSIMAVTDELTGVYNRKEFEHQFKKAVYNFQRNGTPFSLVIIDMDRFKMINDTMGHLMGDEILKQMADAAAKSLRLSDTLFRWGGDEFIIITYGNAESAMLVAERLRTIFAESLAGYSGNGKKKIKTTISCGVAEFTKEDTMDSVLSKADTALYRAKSKGRNRVER